MKLTTTTIAAATLTAMLSLAGCADGDGTNTMANDSHPTSRSAATDGINGTEPCGGYSFSMSQSGQSWLGTNERGEQSQLVLTDVYPDDNPPAAVVFANVAGEELIQETVVFKPGDSKDFAGVGTLTFDGYISGSAASFCFEPDPNFTVADDLTS